MPSRIAVLQKLEAMSVLERARFVVKIARASTNRSGTDAVGEPNIEISSPEFLQKSFPLNTDARRKTKEYTRASMAVRADQGNRIARFSHPAIREDTLEESSRPPVPLCNTAALEM